MATIYVGRHGQDLDNAEKILNGHRDRPLTPLGMNQAKALKDKLKDKKIAAIYSSPLTRAWQTAKCLADELGLEVTKLDDLIERDFGVMTGKPVNDVIKLTPPEHQLITDKIHYFLRAEGAEEFPDVRARVGRVIEFIREKHPNENVLIMGHGDVSKMIRAYYLGLTWYQGLLEPFVDNCDILVLDNGTVTTL